MQFVYITWTVNCIDSLGVKSIFSALDANSDYWPSDIAKEIGRQLRWHQIMDHSIHSFVRWIEGHTKYISACNRRHTIYSSLAVLASIPRQYFNISKELERVYKTVKHVLTLLGDADVSL